MRWLPFVILAYVALGVQLGLSGYVDVYRARPDLVLLAALYVAVNAQRDVGLLACFLLGLAKDLLMPGSPLGLTAFAYGLVAIFILSTQELVYREHFLTHVSLALVSGLITSSVVFAHGLLYPALHKGQPFTRPSVLQLLAGAIYTAVVAPLTMMLLQRTRRAFGFRTNRGYGGKRS